MFFVCFIFFCLRSVLCVLRACFLSKQDKNARAYFFFKTRASMRRCWHRDSLRSDIWCSFFFVSFLTFQFLYFCLLFFGETFGHRASAFLSFLIINMGGPEKKAQFFFWAQLFLLNRSSGGLDYVMSDDLTSFFFFLIIFWECSHSTTFLGVGKPFFPAIVSFFSVSRSYRLGGCGFLVSSKEASQLFFT